MAQPNTTGDEDDQLSLQEAADLLGVHYMTAYRYVRTGRLNADRVGNQWSVPRSSIASLRAASAPGRKKGAGSERRRDYAGDLLARLVVGDEAEAWRLVQNALTSAFTAEQLYLEVLSPALRSVGDGWEAGLVSVAEEHRASAVVNRLIGRLGPSFTPRGPSRGLLVLGAASGDFHGLPTGLIADPLRGHGFAVADLGANVPTESFVEILARDDRARAVGIVVSVPVGDEIVAHTIDAVHTTSSLPVLVGGHAITNAAHATALGADGFSRSASEAIAWFDTIGSAGPRRPRRT